MCPRENSIIECGASDCQSNKINRPVIKGISSTSSSMELIEDVSSCTRNNKEVSQSDNNNQDYHSIITTIRMTSRSSSSSSRMPVPDISKFSATDGHRPAGHECRRVIKKGLPKIIITTILCVLALDFVASQLGSSGSMGVEGAILRRSTVRANLWERPCGDGRWHEQKSTNNNNSNGKKSHVKDVYRQTVQMLNTLNQKMSYGNTITAMDGDWSHYLHHFNFPDISSKFSFRKVHLALQQYMAMFNMFATIAGRNAHNPNRIELKETFEKMQKDSRTLLCLIESVINGTRRAAGPKGRAPAFRYITRNVMERKLKGLSEVLTEQNLLPIAKVVFEKYNAFVDLVSTKSAERAKKRKEINNKVNHQLSSNGKNKNPASKSDSVDVPATKNPNRRGPPRGKGKRRGANGNQIHFKKNRKLQQS